jgi:tetratricopeptide (TPR) repeat protein
MSRVLYLATLWSWLVLLPVGSLLADADAGAAATGDAEPSAGQIAAEPSIPSDAIPVPVPSPRHELDGDLLYSILVGEMAARERDYGLAFTQYLRAARLSGDPRLAELAARSAVSLDDPKAGRRATALWIALAPDALKARQLAAYVAVRSGDRDTALLQLRRVVELSDDPGEGYMAAAQLVTSTEDPKERLALMQALVGEEVDDADAQLALATLAAAADEVDLAFDSARRAAELRPGWSRPPLLIGRLLIDLGRFDEARAEMESSLKTMTLQEAQQLRLVYARLLLDADAEDEALAMFDAVLELEPDQTEALFAAAVLHLQRKDLTEAREYLTRLQSLGKRRNDAAFLLGQLEDEAGDPDQALDWYQQVRGRNAADAQLRIAAIYAAQGKMKQAREILQRLRDQSPEDQPMLFMIEAELLRDQDLDGEALDVYSAALERYPDSGDLLYARALHAVELGQVDVLERDLRHLLISDPDNADALNALGYTLADRTDRLAEAYSFIERALQLRPDEPAILDSMGWVLYRLGKAEQAEPYLRRALEMTFDAEIAAHLGEVLWAMGRRDDARSVWEKAMDEDPKHEYLLRVIGRHRVSHSEAGQ